MKAYNKILLAAGFAGLLASCTDLDTNVESQWTEYPDSEIALEAKLSGVYFHLRGTLGRRYMEAQALSSDEYVGISFSGDYYDSGTYAHMSLHNFSADDASIDWYEDVTNGIAKANRVIEEVGEGKASASPRAIRALYHFILMDCWGDTPILNKVLEDNEDVARSPRAEVALWIADELEAIIPQLTSTVNDNNYGKPTRYMAEALLAKLYINWGVYTAATPGAYDASTYQNPKLSRVIELCDDIINSGNYDLGKTGSYLAKFYPNNGPQIKDFIYVMPYDAVSQEGFQYGRPRAWRKANTGTSYYGKPLSKSCGGNFSITPEMSDLLLSLSKDDRQGHVLNGKVMMYDGTTYQKTNTPWTYKDAEVVLSKTITLTEQDERLDVGNDVNGYCQGYKSVKWFIDDADFSHNRNQSNDLPIFRLADIMLIKAEALVRSNQTGAQGLFNAIRTYANAPTISAEPSLKDILDERGRELFDENWRRNDMIRFGTFESEYGFHKKGFPTARFDKECRIFPLPTSVLNKNTNWKQNPGY